MIKKVINFITCVGPTFLMQLIFDRPQLNPHTTLVDRYRNIIVDINRPHKHCKVIENIFAVKSDIRI